MPSEDDFRAGIGQPLVVQFKPYVTNDAELQFLIARYREYQLEHHDRLTTVYAGIPEAVRELEAAGHPMAVVTSKVDHMARRALTHVGLARHLTVVVAMEHTERHKPDPAPVLLALEHLGTPPEMAIFVGDSPFDIEAGQRAGVTTVGVSWGAYPRHALEEVGADHVLDRPSEIVRFVRGRRASLSSQPSDL